MKIKYISILTVIIFTGLLLIIASSCAFGTSLAKITLKIVDENGTPVQEAKVGAAFMIYTQGGWGSKSKHVQGYSDKQGLFEGSVIADNIVDFSVSKDGYYVSFGTYKFKEHSLGRWQPWNPTITVVMRKIEKPVPMYQRDTKEMHPVLEIPLSGKAVGFDLMEADWVSPYGKGKHADMFFKLDRKFVSRDDFEGTLSITFPSKYDGIQLVKYNRSSGSDYKLPRYAPEEGYQTKLIRTFSKKPGGPYNESAADDNNYFFRVRSEEKDSKYYRAMFGKTHGDIQFDMRGHKTASIIFKYFLNPDYTRNMESGVNLLKLPDREVFNPN